MAMKQFRKKPMPYCSMNLETIMELSKEYIHNILCGSRDDILSTSQFLIKFLNVNRNTKPCIQKCMSNGLVTGSLLVLQFESLGAIPAQIVCAFMLVDGC